MPIIINKVGVFFFCPLLKCRSIARKFRLSVLSIVFFWSACHSNESETFSESKLDPTQQKLIDDLKSVKNIERAIMSDGSDQLLKSLTPGANGTFTLTIEGKSIVIDSRPGTESSGSFTDFFTGLDRGIADFAKRNPPPAVESHLWVLLNSQKKGDFDLQKTRLSRENKTTIKESPIPTGSNFTLERKLYIINGISSMLVARPEPSAGPTRRVSSGVSEECLKRQQLIGASIITFKRGELDRMCGEQVKKMSDLGFRRMVIFYPIHFSGERYTLGFMNKKEFANPMGPNPQRDREYRFETLNSPTSGELERCMGLILDAGLEVSYIPHLESIVTMNAAGEAEWRNNGAIPLNDPQYFDLAYGPIIKSLNSKANTLTSHVTISLAAEVDQSLFHFADASEQLLRRLTSELKLARDQYEIQWNPNGDFSSLDGIAQTFQKRNIDGCGILADLFGEKIDSVAPSLYDSYGHIKPPMKASSDFYGKISDDDYQKQSKMGATLNIPTMVATKSAFLDKLVATFDKQCSGLGTRMKARFKDRFSVGEFSLQGPRVEHLGHFLEEALKSATGRNHRLNFWNDGGRAHDPLVLESSRLVLKDFLQCKK